MAAKKLGVQHGATYRQVHRRYLQLAKQYHPDRCQDPDRFKEIADAFDQLRDFFKFNQRLELNEDKGRFRPDYEFQSEKQKWYRQ